MRFSVIVPVYNVEKYLSRCLDSILNQSLQDFELVVVNDGSPDNSQAIIDDYASKYPEKIRAFQKENGGLSDARNYGVERAKGEYLLFVDSDDYLDPSALEQINICIQRNTPDVVGFHFSEVTETGEVRRELKRPQGFGISGEEAIIRLVELKQYFEPAWGFAYRKEYWTKNGFAFMKGIYHEDFALMPLVVLRAKKVDFLHVSLYFYVSTEGSITRTQGEKRIRRLAKDLLEGYDFLISSFYEKPCENRYAGKMYLAYAANTVIGRLENLSGDLKKDFRNEVRQRNVVKHLIDNTFKRKVRKFLFRLKYKI